MYSESSAIAPIYSLIVATTFLAVMLGIIFKDMLEYQVALWTANPDAKSQINYKTGNIVLAYSLTSLFVLFSVALSLTVFVQIFWLASAIAVAVVVPTAFLMWFQLGSMLQLWSDKGIEAIDLDFFAVNQASEKSTES
ncbi:hypothetical protein ACL6C3_07645 [Capilliphycus salinus ALCB114379]|uniref:hypothetical protein n=1 Tax=Capilliphycus salinus TaxID=2768948 RepID=UPI0039A75F57